MRMIKEVRDLIYDHWLWLCIAATIGVLVWVRWLVRRPRYLPKSVTMRDVTMTHEARKMHVRRVAMNSICDGILNAVLDGEISEDEANFCMAEIATLWNQKELMPLINAKRTAVAKNRMKANKRRRDLHGPDEPLPLPKPESVKTKVSPLDVLLSL